MAEWLGRALQKLLQQFESARDLAKAQQCARTADRRSFYFSRIPLPLHFLLYENLLTQASKINYQRMFFEGRNSQTMIPSLDSRETTVYSVIGDTFVIDRGAFRVTADCMRPMDIGKPLEEIIN